MYPSHRAVHSSAPTLKRCQPPFCVPRMGAPMRHFLRHAARFLATCLARGELATDRNTVIPSHRSRAVSPDTGRNAMAKPCIICVAITGSLPKKSDNPAVPVTVSEQIESTQAAFEAGATIVHAHVRDDDQNPTSDPERFARLKEGVERHCPGMVIQFSTGGRAASGKTRGGMLP